MSSRKAQTSTSLIAVLGASTLLTGCITVPKYELPADAPIAHIVVKTPKNPPFTEEIGVSIFQDATVCNHPHILSKFVKADDEPVKTPMEAGREQTLRMVQLTKTKYGEYSCAPVFSFTPQPGHTYELTMVNQGMTCRPVLTETIGSESNPVFFRLRPVHETVLHRGSGLCSDVDR